MDRQPRAGHYSGLTTYKIFAVTDSDLESPISGYQPTPKAIYRFFTGITDKNAQIDRQRNIDTFSQPLYFWHMWRKRAIENYFPPEAYEAAGMNADDYRLVPLPDRNFSKIDEKKTPIVKNYDKKDLPKIAASMSKTDYEQSCDILNLSGVRISEIRLILLKMARVI